MTGLSILDRLPRFLDAGASSVKPGLDRIRALLSRLGDPHRAAPVIHVAGTNGKGSTASFIAALFAATGLRCGLHTSPHLVSVAERMRIDGLPAPLDWLDEALESLEPAITRIGPSYFEVTVALSFAWFAARKADVAVVEVGLGGRLDATNIVDPAVCVLTDIGLDHTDILGETVEVIAAEKAGIMKPGVPVLASDSGAAVEAVFRRAADRIECPFHLAREEITVQDKDPVTVSTPVGRYGPMSIGLPGAHQVRNAALAVRASELAFEALHRPTPEASVVERALREVVSLAGIRGRMEVLQPSPLVVVDVAHNEAGIRAAIETLRTLAPTGDRVVVLGIMGDKDAVAVMDIVARDDARIVPVTIPSPRAADAQHLAMIARDRGVVVDDVIEDGPQAIVEWIRSRRSPDESILVTGSHLVAGPVLQSWH